MSQDNESWIVFMYGCMVSLRILWCSQSGDHPENNLTKFGYMIDMKVGKKNNILLYSWLPFGSYHKTLATWKKKIEIWQILC